VVITDARTNTPVAEFVWKRLGRHGTLRMVDGGHLQWRETGRWRSTFTFADRFGNPLLRLHSDGRGLSYGLNALLGPPKGRRMALCCCRPGMVLGAQQRPRNPPEPAVMP
jgi:hypothetical protein